MHEFQRVQLARADEAAVVRVRETQRQESKEIGEEKVDRQVRIRVADKVKPFVARDWDSAVD